MSEPDEGIESGTAGASARAEHERRRARREADVRERFPRAGGLILALQTAPQHEQAWATGALGEERVAARLAKAEGVMTLHDRRMPRSRANIDHIAIGPAGVFVIDAKRYKDKKVEVRRRGGLFSKKTEHLYVGGREKPGIVDGVERQRAAVEAAVRSWTEAEVPVRAVLCFVEAEIPLMGTLTVDGVRVTYPRKLKKLCEAAGALDSHAIAMLHAHLAGMFPAV